MARGWSPRLITMLAFGEQALGLHPRSRPFEDIPQRSARALERLGGPPDGLRFQVALRQLARDWDLMCEEATENADALRLQLRVLELAPTVPEAEALLRPHLQDAPLARLFHAIVAQAWQNVATEIEIDFGDDPIRVAYDGREAMTVPAKLERPLRGVLRRVEAAGFARLRGFLWAGGNAPQDLGFAWDGADRLMLAVR